MPSRRDVAVDSLRGLALVLMVAGHVIGSNPDVGIRVSDDSGWRFFYLMLEDIRMPLFTVLSGFVFAMRPLPTTATFGKMVKGKARRLIVPLFVVGTIFYLFQALMPGTNHRPELSEFWQVYVLGYGHFWFLIALFWIFLATAVLGLVGALATPARWVGCVIATSAVFVVVTIPDGWNIFAAYGTLRLMPFFLLGYGLFTFRAQLKTRALVICAAALAVATLGYKARMIATGFDSRAYLTESVSVLAGVSLILILVRYRDALASPFLAWLGQFSFGVYLLHVFGTAGARMVMGRLGVEDPWTLFITSLIAGIAAPIIFEILFGRFAIVSWGVLGQKPRKRRHVLTEAQDAPLAR